MSQNLSSRSFNFVYWVMLFFLIGDTLDTVYRFLTGYFVGGSSFPGVNVVIQPTALDLIVFLLVQIFVLYGIYLLYKLRRVGGFWFMGAQLFFLIYTSFFGPISKIGLSTVLLPVTLFMCVYVVLVIFVPFYYSEKFK